MAQRVEQLLATLVPFPIQLLANMPWKATDDGTGTWTPATHVEDQEEAPGSCHQLELAPLGSETADERFLSLCLPLSDIQINK